jgi:AraC-like DNA-binding protein
MARLARARDMLCEEHDTRLTIDDVAREAALSPYHFIRLFTAVFGETPHQLRIGARLDKSRQLLILENHSVTEICNAVGFSSLGTFSDLFTRRVGSSPTAWRRHARTLVQVPGTLPPSLYPGCWSLMWAWPQNATTWARPQNDTSLPKNRNFQEARPPSA